MVSWSWGTCFNDGAETGAFLEGPGFAGSFAAKATEETAAVKKRNRIIDLFIIC